ncbi:hypothetical protein PGTUg99_028961 [Puccinia graminis f. sp. tritici]|uniref:DUF659 domain-containing protein n=1 Tax=Puccinia graminis f. sp. tritici TaxID=56615 RepID=A0A5B0NKP9_PUCGR|nr:hypothetical protein PGTUg99_028961 [Puccinia graminis f. sp. tritici]
MLYSAIQEDYKAILKSPNGFDILGIVVYRLAEDESGETKLESMPLDFIRLARSHTGEYLAQTVSLVVEKFGIQDKICGIVSDNASNNKVMVSELKKKKWARFKGEPHWIRCFAHVLNLIAQAILRPFGSQKKSKTTNQSGSIPLDNSEDSGSGDEDEEAEEQIRP